ncbi:MAG: AAA family ATPase, partial [Oleispira sp.]|nr:AAA family ATPase [Oleispira sp.]
MAKKKTAYVCTECGGEHTKWQGQCSECNEWNTLSEFVVSANKQAASRDVKFAGYAGGGEEAGKVHKLVDINLNEVPRFSSGMQEFDRVLGGGLVPGSAILIGGHPGAGKSTLLLQVMCYLAQQMPTLYITGEESLQQVARRAQRLGLPMNNLQMLSETNVEAITRVAQQE